MTVLAQSLRTLLDSMTGPRKSATDLRGHAHEILINHEFEQSKKYLQSLLALDENTLKLALRQFLKLRWAYIRNTAASYDQFVKQPLNGMNAACAQIAALIADSNEALAVVLMPTITIQYYANLEESLQDLTEKKNSSGQRVLDLSNIIVNQEGTCVIPLKEWFEAQGDALEDQTKPYLKYLHRLGVDGSEHLLSYEEFEAQKNTPPYDTCVTFQNYVDQYQAPPMTEADLDKMAAVCDEISKDYLDDSRRYLELLAKPCTLYDATLKLCNDLKANGVKGSGEEFGADPAVYPLIKKYFEDCIHLCTEADKEKFFKVRCCNRTFGQYLLMLKAYSFPLSDKEYEQVNRDQVFTCIDLASNDIKEMLNKNEAFFKQVDACKSVEALMAQADAIVKNLEKRKGVEHLKGSHSLLVDSKKGYVQALGNLQTGQTAGDLDYLQICHEAFDEDQFKNIIRLFSLEQANACWVQAENKTPKELALLLKYMTQFPVHKFALCAAARMGSEAMVDSILARDKTAINSSDLHGMNPLAHAVKHGHPSLVMKLLKNGAVPSGFYGDEKRSLLHWAVTHHHTEIAVYLIDSGVLLNERYNAERFEGSRTLLSDAVAKGCTPIIEACFRRLNDNPDDLNINDASDKGWTALHYAASHGNTPVVKALLAKGARLTMTRAGAGNALHEAIARGRQETVEAIIQSQAFMQLTQRQKFLEVPNAQGYTPLGLALYNHNSSLAILLINSGADFSGKYHHNKTLLAIAAENRSPSLVLALMNKGVDLSETYSRGHHLLMRACDEGWTEVALACIELNQFDLHSPVEGGWTTLHYAARNGNLPVVKKLLGRGVSPWVQKDDGFTPLHNAAFMCRLEILDELLRCKEIHEEKNGVKLIDCLNNEGKSAIEIVWERDTDECLSAVLALVRAGADYTTLPILDNRGLLSHAIHRDWPDFMEACFASLYMDPEIKDNDGWRAIHYAAVNGNAFALGSLLVRAAGLDHLTDEGQTALELAIERDHPLIVELLLEAGARLESPLYEKCLAYAQTGQHEGILQKISVHQATVSSVLHMLMFSLNQSQPEAKSEAQNTVGVKRPYGDLYD